MIKKARFRDAFVLSPGRTAAVAIGAALACRAAFAFTPNEIKITKYVASGTDKIDHTYADGLNRKIQTREEFNGDDVVVGFVYDKYGRLVKTTKPFMNTNAHAYAAGDPTTLANTYYDGTSNKPNAGGKAYTESGLYDDPTGRIKTLGEPGSAFSLAGHAAKTWYLARATQDFLPVSSLNDGTLDNFKEANPLYHLKVVRNSNGQYTQVLSDAFGQALQTWSDPSTAAGDEIVTQSFFDNLGNPNMSAPPGAGGLPDWDRSVSATRLSTGEVYSGYSPDQGGTSNLYDRAGRLRFIQNGMLSYNGYGSQRFEVVKYDAFGRETVRGTYMSYDNTVDVFTQANAENANFPGASDNGTFQPRIQRYYDNTQKLIAEQGLSGSYLGQLTNLKGRLVAEVNTNDWTDAVVTDLYGYDGAGRTTVHVKLIPNAPIQFFRFTYDYQDRVATKIYQNLDNTGAVTFQSVWDYVYSQGRLVSVNKDGKKIMGYSQYPTGELSSKVFSKNGTDVGHLDFTYHIRGWASRLQAFNTANTQLYKEDLFYETGTTTAPKYNGDLVKDVETYQSPASTITQDYAYDQVDRETAAYSSNGTTYNEGFAYDAAGKIITKMEGSAIRGPYVYGGEDNKLLYITGHPTKGNSADGNYQYDYNGNMVLDRSKKMVVFYDWRDMPVSFRFFDSLPSGSIPMDELYGPSGSTLIAEVQMGYDAKGTRVFKQTYKY